MQPNGTFGGVTDPENPSCPPGTTQATTPLMMHVWIVDNDCGHRFGGVGLEGLHCDHGGHGPGHDPGSDDPAGHDGGHGHTPLPARPVTAAPMFTG